MYMDMWDTDKSGTVSVSELAAGLSYIGVNVPESVAACAHATYDTNGDHELQLEELAILVSADDPFSGCAHSFGSFSFNYGPFSFSCGPQGTD